MTKRRTTSRRRGTKANAGRESDEPAAISPLPAAGRESDELAAVSPPDTSKGTITAINLPADLLELLRIVAVKRARAGGRPSVSAVLVDLVQRHRDELEAEAAVTDRAGRRG